MSNLYIYIN